MAASGGLLAWGAVVTSQALPAQQCPKQMALRHRNIGMPISPGARFKQHRCCVQPCHSSPHPALTSVEAAEPIFWSFGLPL